MPIALHPTAGRQGSVSWPAFWQASFRLACLAVLATLSGHAGAQAAQNPSLVLVLNVFSDTHVKPVTGVVLSEDGLVLVPADFISQGDRIVVLDGGFDLEQNARRGRVIARSVDAGLAVVAVDGLQRPPLVVTNDPTPGVEGLRLQAWPPAEQLKDSPTLLTRDAAPDLPNLSGPLLNSCGQLAGMHLAVDTPGLEPVENDRTLVLEDLLNGLEALALEPQRAWCRAAPSSETGTTDTSAGRSRGSELEVLDEQGRPLETSTPRSQQPAAPATRPDTADQSAGDPATEALPGLLNEPDIQPADNLPSARPTPEPPEPDPESSLVWMAGMSLAGILFAIWLIMNIRRSSKEAERHQEAAPAAPPTPVPVTIYRDNHEGDPQQWTELLAPGRPEYSIGALGADIEIDDPSVLRRHARLLVDEGRLCIGSVDERAGLWVNGLPCLEGEIVIIGPDDVVTLGRIRCRFRLEDGE